MKESDKTFGRGRFLFVLLAFTAVVVFLLWSEHRAHILGALPFVLLLLCPLLHLFLHRGHHHRHGDTKDGEDPQKGGPL